ncbi:sulfite exporter TauE/SafE family protein 3-like [Papaver somniferum]|uniref:sulfite exporter TauE/SafE family protein 3-like n=1 Tax=Papaver somniferum TaxID=3469 RepID=UPI000E704D83|nr:sulfite exporter TauE/SafE family protein 3-like [Papaver somniferum]
MPFQVPVLKNVYWKELGVLRLGRIPCDANPAGKCCLLFLADPCFGRSYFVPGSLHSQGKEGARVYGRSRYRIESLSANPLLFSWCTRGMVFGLLGIGGGFILGPMFLQIGVPLQVASATASFAMMFSSSMPVIKFYLLKRFPIPYAAYFLAVAIVAAAAGQYVVRKLIITLGSASLIVFLLVTLFFVSAFLLGGVGISNMVKQIQHKEYMGFENLCHA